MYKSCFLGFGSYLPEKILTNNDLSSFLETDDEWIRKRTGISSRHIADESESNVDLAFYSAMDAIKNSALQPTDIDLIVFATTTPDAVFPSCGVLLQQRLKCVNAVAFDIQAVCSGFLFGMSVASCFVESGKFKNALVIGSDIMSSIVDWTDRSTAILFGDGSGAAVISRSTDEKSMIIDSLICSDGDLAHVLRVDGGVRSGSMGKVQMNGRVVFEHAIQKMSAASIELISRNGISIEQIDWFVPHQANIRIIDLVASKIGINPEKVLITIDSHANTSAASIPMAFDYFVRAGKISKGDLVLISAVGGGLTWGAALFRY